jgi:hypothetical protein
VVPGLGRVFLGWQVVAEATVEATVEVTVEVGTAVMEEAMVVEEGMVGQGALLRRPLHVART